MIYTEDVLREEYAEYFKLLIAENYLKDDIEYLEVNDLQGINGLLAIRASINYRKEVTKYIELKD